MLNLCLLAVRKTLAMLLWELAKRPRLQLALREEITNFRGSGPNERSAYDDYVGSKLPLLDAVVKEG